MEVLKVNRLSWNKLKNRQFFTKFSLLSFMLFYVFGISSIGFAAPPAPTVYLQSESQTIGPNSAFSVEVREDSGTLPVNAVQANFNYPADLIDFVSFDSANSAFSIEAQKMGGNGQITIARGASPALTGNQLITKVNFKSKTTGGTVDMAFRSDTALVSSTTNQNLLSSVAATGGANYTIDAIGPEVSIVSPNAGTTVSGNSVNIAANATDDSSVTSVQFMLDGNNLGPDITAAPYAYAWDSTAVADGTHSITATARDFYGNVATSSPVSIMVTNTAATPDTTSPSDPTNLTAIATSTSQVNLNWSGSTDAGGSGLRGYQIYRDSTLVSTTTATSYSDTALNPSTNYSYYVVAYDNAGNQSMPSNQVTVTTKTPAPIITNLTLTPAADAYINQTKPNANYGSTSTLLGDASPNEDILIRFNVTGIGTGKVNAAKLKLYVNRASNSGGVVKRAVSSTWTETNLNWNNKPAVNSTTYGTIGSTSKNSFVEVDLASLITTDGIYDLYIDNSSTNDVAYNSKEASTNKPQLLLTVAK
jgi:chitodextrinase